MTTEEMREIALGIFTGAIFTSNQIEERDMSMLPMIFMPLALMSNEQRQELVDQAIRI